MGKEFFSRVSVDVRGQLYLHSCQVGNINSPIFGIPINLAFLSPSTHMFCQSVLVSILPLPTFKSKFSISLSSCFGPSIVLNSTLLSPFPLHFNQYFFDFCTFLILPPSKSIYVFSSNSLSFSVKGSSFQPSLHSS